MSSITIRPETEYEAGDADSNAPAKQPQYTIYEFGKAQLWVDRDLPILDGTLFLDGQDVQYWTTKRPDGLALIRDLTTLLADPAVQALLAALTTPTSTDAPTKAGA